MSEIQNNPSKGKMQNSTAVFADYARYYDLLYRDKDYTSEAEYVAGLIRKFLAANNRWQPDLIHAFPVACRRLEM